MALNLLLNQEKRNDDGGDDFVVEKISITCTRMEIIIRFLNV